MHTSKVGRIAGDRVGRRESVDSVGNLPQDNPALRQGKKEKKDRSR
jgi:hypothetical protein